MKSLLSMLKAGLKVSAAALGSLTAAIALTYGFHLLKRPARTSVVKPLFQGVKYERYARQLPRPLMFHVISVDLTTPGIKFIATPQGNDPSGKETLADTTKNSLLWVRMKR